MAGYFVFGSQSLATVGDCLLGFWSGNLIVGALLCIGIWGGSWLLLCNIVADLILLLTLHSILWHFLKRPVYAVARFGLFGHRRLIIGLGLTLLILCVPK
jgi:hypothetical protein